MRTGRNQKNRLSQKIWQELSRGFIKDLNALWPRALIIVISYQHTVYPKSLSCTVGEPRAIFVDDVSNTVKINSMIWNTRRL